MEQLTSILQIYSATMKGNHSICTLEVNLVLVQTALFGVAVIFEHLHLMNKQVSMNDFARFHGFLNSKAVQLASCDMGVLYYP
jgi:hypothetical protein